MLLPYLPSCFLLCLLSLVLDITLQPPLNPMPHTRAMPMAVLRPPFLVFCVFVFVCSVAVQRTVSISSKLSCRVSMLQFGTQKKQTDLNFSPPLLFSLFPKCPDMLQIM